MKTLIFALLVADLTAFAFGKTYVAGRTAPLEYAFLIFDKLGYKHEAYKNSTASVTLKLVGINQTPYIIWEKKLEDSLSLFTLPDEKKPLVRKFSIGIISKDAYLVYEIKYNGYQNRTLSIQHATYIDRKKRKLYIGL